MKYWIKLQNYYYFMEGNFVRFGFSENDTQNIEKYKNQIKNL